MTMPPRPIASLEGVYCRACGALLALRVGRNRFRPLRCDVEPAAHGRQEFVCPHDGSVTRAPRTSEQERQAA